MPRPPHLPCQIRLLSVRRPPTRCAPVVASRRCTARAPPCAAAATQPARPGPHDDDLRLSRRPLPPPGPTPPATPERPELGLRRPIRTPCQPTNYEEST